MSLKPFDIPCVILSGGKSSRMGEDKSLLSFENSSSLIQYQYERLKPYFKNIYISSKKDKFDFQANLIIDEDEVYSPIVALQKILQTLDSQKVFIITVDTPFVKIETISKLIEESNGFEITVAKTSRVHNLSGVFNKCNLSVINNMLKNDIHKVGYLLNNSNTNIINFHDEIEFLNINNKQDYNTAKLNISSTNN